METISVVFISVIPVSCFICLYRLFNKCELPCIDDNKIHVENI